MGARRDWRDGQLRAPADRITAGGRATGGIPTREDGLASERVRRFQRKSVHQRHLEARTRAAPGGPPRLDGRTSRQRLCNCVVTGGAVLVWYHHAVAIPCNCVSKSCSSVERRGRIGRGHVSPCRLTGPRWVGRAPATQGSRGRYLPLAAAGPWKRPAVGGSGNRRVLLELPALGPAAGCPPLQRGVRGVIHIRRRG